MKGPIRTNTFLVALLLSLASPAGGIAAQEATTLKLQELLTMARDQSPRVLAAEFRVRATQAREPGAGLLPDPFLQIGVMNLALPELSANMPASMAPSIQAMQRFPVAGKRSLREEIAHRSSAIDVAASEEVWWEVRTAVAAAFYGLYQVDRRVEVMEETLGLLENFETVARSLYATGAGRQADVLRANVEVARMEADIERMRAGRRGTGARLNALIGRPASTPVPTPELNPLPREVPEHETLLGWASEGRPVLAGMRLEVDRAGSQRELAAKEIWPDFTVGLQYGLGRMQGDYRSMGGASVGFSLPVYAGKRQRKLEEEAAATEGMARARLDDALAFVDARVGELLAELDQNRTLLVLYREEILPQARAAAESSLSAYQAGSVDFMTLVDAQMAVNRFQGEYFSLLASYGTALAQLEMTIGRDLTVGVELIMEDR